MRRVIVVPLVRAMALALGGRYSPFACAKRIDVQGRAHNKPHRLYGYRYRTYSR